MRAAVQRYDALPLRNLRADRQDYKEALWPRLGQVWKDAPFRTISLWDRTVLERRPAML
jgi:hypothetical protein